MTTSKSYGIGHTPWLFGSNRTSICRFLKRCLKWLQWQKALCVLNFEKISDKVSQGVPAKSQSLILSHVGPWIQLHEMFNISLPAETKEFKYLVALFTSESKTAWESNSCYRCGTCCDLGVMAKRDLSVKSRFSFDQRSNSHLRSWALGTDRKQEAKISFLHRVSGFTLGGQSEWLRYVEETWSKTCRGHQTRRDPGA